MKLEEYKVICKCPHCQKGEVRGTEKAKLEISVICNKCQKAYIINWETFEVYSGFKMKRQK